MQRANEMTFPASRLPPDACVQEARVSRVASGDALSQRSLGSTSGIPPARVPSLVVVMALKAGRRPDLGERMAAGEVRPVSTRLIVGIMVGVVVLVTVAILALIIASGTTRRNSPTSNVPSAVTPSTSQSGPAGSVTP
jgi:hypothetical protein